MNLTPYKRVLSLPGVTALIIVGSAARFPVAAMNMAMLFHVREGLHGSYLQAGLVSALLTVGAAVGSTVNGRLIDRVGLRPVLAVTGVATAVFWTTAPLMSYPVLAACALLAGLAALPVFGTIRQALAAMVPPDQRRTAYSLDAMGVEIAFIVAPAGAIFIASANSEAALYCVAGLAAMAALMLFRLNPPTKNAEELAEMAGQARPARRTWLRGPMVAMLIAAVGATIALGGGEVSMVAMLKAHGQESQSAIVLGLWAAFSLIGGFVYGGLNREVHPLLLLLGMCVALLPLALTTTWWAMALVLIPAGMLCAPSLSAMSDKVSKLVPASVRGEAMGMHGSAITVGGAIGAPIVGAIIDHLGAPWGFVAAGGGGALLAFAGWLLITLDRTPAPAEEPARAAEPVLDTA
ncbi:MFS transporter [Actinorhabdospora filicis]|uniref:MFS transporter n=1 Tax=Actinorhabdospora filicis TaxID=1785913 RepID=A0A9W6SH41_9ACTN|nr:MFS transporter [Actinorhabdospora filicis]GLZ75309.1 MFS transporter [Actinorhabdospora filicis]